MLMKFSFVTDWISESFAETEGICFSYRAIRQNGKKNKRREMLLKIGAIVLIYPV